MKKNKYEIDMCNGTIMDKLISFSLPLTPGDTPLFAARALRRAGFSVAPGKLCFPSRTSRTARVH